MKASQSKSFQMPELGLCLFEDEMLVVGYSSSSAVRWTDEYCVKVIITTATIIIIQIIIYNLLFIITITNPIAYH